MHLWVCHHSFSQAQCASITWRNTNVWWHERELMDDQRALDVQSHNALSIIGKRMLDRSHDFEVIVYIPQCIINHLGKGWQIGHMI